LTNIEIKILEIMHNMTYGIIYHAGELYETFHPVKLKIIDDKDNIYFEGNIKEPIITKIIVINQ
jgi:hypothetical protein